MNTRHPFLCMASIASAIACVLIFMQPIAATTTTFDVDVDAPLTATLLPTLSVTAKADGTSSAQCSDEAALPVTLLPTVHVRAGRRLHAGRPAHEPTLMAEVAPVSAMQVVRAN